MMYREVARMNDGWRKNDKCGKNKGLGKVSDKWEKDE